MARKIFRQLLMVFAFLFLVSISANADQACENECSDVHDSCVNTVYINYWNTEEACGVDLTACMYLAHQNYPGGTSERAHAEDACFQSYLYGCHNPALSVRAAGYASCDSNYTACIDACNYIDPPLPTCQEMCQNTYDECAQNVQACVASCGGNQVCLNGCGALAYGCQQSFQACWNYCQ